MKPIHYILICCLLGMSSCGGMDSFSKRKYLQKAPKQKLVEQVYDEPVAYVNTELTPEAYVLEEIPEVDYQLQEYNLNAVKQNEFPQVNYSKNRQDITSTGKKIVDNWIDTKLNHSSKTGKLKPTDPQTNMGKVFWIVILLGLGILFLLLGLAIELSGAVGVGKVLYVLAFLCGAGIVKLWLSM